MVVFQPAGLNERILPVHPDVTKAVKFEHRTCSGVLTTRPGTGEIRIPTVNRQDAGDFRRCMDALVTDLDHRRLRFVNYFEPDLWERTYGEITPDDARRITDAVRDFAEEQEHWTGQNPFNGTEYDRKPVNTLVGEWTPNERP